MYWLAVVLISVVGTLFTDNLVDNFGISLPVSTAVFGLALAATFVTQAGQDSAPAHRILPW